MDHLPKVKDPYEPIDIPYLGGKEYDGLDFDGYPARQNWRSDLLVNGDLQGRTAVEAAQFLQTWLYFGMLHEALKLAEDDRIDVKDFVHIDKSQQKFITTHRLPELLRHFHQRAKQVQNVGTYYKRFRACIKLSCGTWRGLMESSGNENTLQLLRPEILLSIQILGAALDIGITEAISSWVDYTWKCVPQSKWLMQRMIGQGWCPAIVEQISQPCATFLYYASLLGPPRRGDKHSTCSANDKACRATNIREGEKYEVKHVVEGCSCENVEIPTGDGSPVANSISNGDIS